MKKSNIPQEPLLMSKPATLKQIADYFQVSPSTVYGMAQRGEIPAFKVGRQWRFSWARIRQWEMEQESPSAKAKEIMQELK